MVGYYVLTSASVQYGDVTGKVRRNMPDPIPVILLSRLPVRQLSQACTWWCQAMRPLAMPAMHMQVTRVPSG